MNPYALIGGFLAAVLLVFGSLKVGMAITQGKWDEAELVRAEKIVVRVKREVVEVPKIVERVVVQEKTVEKEVERVVTVIPRLLAPDCVLPDRYGELLVGAARGLEPDPSTGRIAETAGTYGCREVLDATLRDLAAGWKNTGRAAGLQEYVRLKQQP